MANLLTFTSADEIRAVLGVSPEELEDDTVELPLYFKQLQFDLSDVASGLEASYLAVHALPIASRTSVQQKLLDVTSVYSSYAISRLLLTSLSAFAPKQITDGKAATTRVEDPFLRVREGVEAQYAVLRARLLAAYAASGNSVGATTSRVYVVAAGLGTNPVTNS